MTGSGSRAGDFNRPRPFFCSAGSISCGRAEVNIFVMVKYGLMERQHQRIHDSSPIPTSESATPETGVALVDPLDPYTLVAPVIGGLADHRLFFAEAGCNDQDIKEENQNSHDPCRPEWMKEYPESWTEKQVWRYIDGVNNWTTGRIQRELWEIHLRLREIRETDE